MLTGRPKLAAYGGGQQGKLLRRSMQDVARNGVSGHGGFIHQRRQQSHTRARPLIGVEAMQRLVGILTACGLEQNAVQRGGRAPAFFVAQYGAQSLAGDIEGTALVPEDVTPTSGPGGALSLIAAESDRPGARDDGDARLTRGRAGEGGDGIGSDHQRFDGEDSLEHGALIGRASAHSEAGGGEPYVAGGETRAHTGGGHRFFYRPSQLPAAFPGAGMVAWASGARAQHAAGLVTDQRGGAGLTAIHSEEQLHLEDASIAGAARRLAILGFGSEATLQVVAGVDLGGTAINYTLVNQGEQFLIEGLCEYPARSKEGPDVCLQQIEDGLRMAVARAGVTLGDVTAIGLDTPGPASPEGVLSAEGSTNFVHAGWGGYDIREHLSKKLDKPVTYLNDGNAGALWGHFAIFGAHIRATSISVVIGTGLGGGVIVDGNVLKGRKGFGGELGHVLIPYRSIRGIGGLRPQCNCGRMGDLEALCSLTAIEQSLLPFFLSHYPGHELTGLGDLHKAAKLVRGLAERGDPMSKEIFRVQAHALGLFFDEMVNAFDPDALIVGGGALETGMEFQRWFLDEIRAAMPVQRAEQADIPIHVMPNGDTAGARGAAIEALKLARQSGFAPI